MRRLFTSSRLGHPAIRWSHDRFLRHVLLAMLLGLALGLVLGARILLAESAPHRDSLPRKALFGAQLAPVPDSVRTQHNLAAGEGLLLLTVTPGTTAATAQFRAGDVLLGVGSTRVTSPQIGVTALRAVPVGQRVSFTFLRGERRQTVEIVMRERPRQEGPLFSTHYDHVTVGDTRYRVMVTQPRQSGRPIAGRHPALFVIGGIGAYSLDGPFDSIFYGDMLEAVVERGWATIRVDKAGQGDSEGGPTPESDFESELAMYKAVLASLPRYDFVDTARVHLFGHSMGGVFGPLLMAERAAGMPRFKSLVVYGTIAKPWMEYWVEAVRRQTTAAGHSLPVVDQLVRDQSALVHYLVVEGLEPSELRSRHPALAAALGQHFADGRTLSGLAFPFWRQLAKRRVADAWAAVDGRVLALFGESDVVSARDDHELVAAIVNEAHPGRATFATVPNSDHTFRSYATMEASLRAGPQMSVPVNPATRERLLAWLAEMEPGAGR